MLKKVLIKFRDKGTSFTSYHTMYALTQLKTIDWSGQKTFDPGRVRSAIFGLGLDLANLP